MYTSDQTSGDAFIPIQPSPPDAVIPEQIETRQIPERQRTIAASYHNAGKHPTRNAIHGHLITQRKRTSFQSIGSSTEHRRDHSRFHSKASLNSDKFVPSTRHENVFDNVSKRKGNAHYEFSGDAFEIKEGIVSDTFHNGDTRLTKRLKVKRNELKKYNKLHESKFSKFKKLLQSYEAQIPKKKVKPKIVHGTVLQKNPSHRTAVDLNKILKQLAKKIEPNIADGLSTSADKHPNSNLRKHSLKEENINRREKRLKMKFQLKKIGPHGKKTHDKHFERETGLPTSFWRGKKENISFFNWKRRLLQVDVNNESVSTKELISMNLTKLQNYSEIRREIDASTFDDPQLQVIKNLSNEKNNAELPQHEIEKDSYEDLESNDNLFGSYYSPIPSSAEFLNTSALNHLNLDLLEEELAKKDSNSQKDLLLAISILQHHSLPYASTTKETNTFTDIISTVEETHDLKKELMHSNEESLEEDSYPMLPENLNLGFAVDIDDRSRSKPSSESRFSPSLPQTMFLEPESPFIPDKLNSTNDNPSLYNSDASSDVYSSPDIQFLPNDFLYSKILTTEHEKFPQIDKKKNLTHPQFRPRQPVKISPMKEKPLKWIILVMDGDCGIISKRMNTFVMFLKAALSSRLEIEYDDIYVMSVFCDNTFMVNISLDTNLYSRALTQLQALADANTTLLEISGEIFYLDRIVSQRNIRLLGRLQGNEPPQDVEVVVYIAVGCVCTFILISVFLVTLVNICKKDPEEIHDTKSNSIDKSNFPIRKPNVIYSHKFTQELNPEKYRLTPFEDRVSGGCVAPTESVSFESGRHLPERSEIQARERYQERKTFLNPSSSKIQLLEEVQEEDEDEIEDGAVLEGDEDYHEEDEEAEEVLDDDYDDFIFENMTRPLHPDNPHHQHSIMRNHHEESAPSSSLVRPDHHTHSCCHASEIPPSFDNPCYNR